MWKYHTKKRELYYDRVIKLYQEEGLNYERISKIIPVSSDTVSNWIRTFVAENQNSTHMAKTNHPQKVSPVPGSESADVKVLQSEIARLKKQLAHETLRADAYDELINVAEKQFNISIRKKAGAKQ
ncbi:MAG: helix-turn-helix domain-containing protein [Bacteroidaceae bacterium]|nr:helix-turn-helix domain-containing protein [Bacteroidaceae bacterium]